MNNYIYAADAAPVLPAGTTLRVTAWYDNTPNNRNNPDPSQWVGFGDRTVDEMGHAWVNITYLSQDDYNAWAAKNKVVAANASRPATARFRAATVMERFFIASVLLCTAASAQAQSAAPYQMGELHESGQGVTGAFEGWFKKLRRQLQFPSRLFQPEHERRIGHSDWPEQWYRTWRSRSGPAHPLPRRPPMGFLHGDRSEGFRIKQTNLDPDRPTARATKFPSA
jgi:hypothetical protein